MRNRLRPLRQQVEKLERALATCETGLKSIEDALADETLYQPEQKTHLNDLLSKQATARQQQQQLESELLAAMEALEEAEQQAEHYRGGDATPA